MQTRIFSMGIGRKPVKVFLLCAGYGTRLRPITEHIPKPLIPLLGRPLLDHIMEKLGALKPEAIGINVHHLPEKMLSYCEKRGGIEVFFEREILGTGGALRNAEAFLSEGTFLVHNGDILAEVDYEDALRFHKESGAFATLLVTNIPWQNNLLVDEEGRLLEVLSAQCQSTYAEGLRRVGFTGIAIYEPEFLAYLPRGYSSVTEGWMQAIRAGETILTYSISGAWFDLGTPERYLGALFHLLKREGENLFIHPLAEVEDLELRGFVSIETRTKLRGKTCLSNVLVIAENEIISGSYENGILFGNRFIQLSEEEIPFREERGFEVGFGGSERRFFRGPNSRILMVDPRKEDLEKTVAFNRCLKSRGIRLPDILEIREGEVIFRDLGDLSLYNFIKLCRDGEKLREIYRKVLDEVVKLHIIPIDREIAEIIPPFDRSYFRWETRYFEEKFLNFFCGLKANEALLKEFDRLAEISSGFPVNLIHRDLQSQNILICNGEVYFIDYQGARLGPAGYDIASLIFDPYWEQSEDFRKWAIDYYVDRRLSLDPSFDRELFLSSLPYLTFQRHLQALSAYVNLSLFKGKRHFFRFIPRCLRYLLRDVEILGEEFPILSDYLRRGREILKERGILAGEEALSV